MHLDPVPGDATGRVDDLLNRETQAVAQVVRLAPGPLQQPLQRQPVGPAQIADVHVVADAGAVGGAVVLSEHRDVGPFSCSRLQHQRNQVGFWFVPLTQLPLRISASGVEIAQADRLEPVGPVVVLKGLFDHQLAAAVRVDRPFGVVFADLVALRITKHRSRRGKNETLNACRCHGIQQGQRVCEVVAVVLAGRLHGFADLNE